MGIRQQKSRIALITSSTSADGETTEASNHSRTLVDDAKRVVLVDAELHRGRVHGPPKLRREPGLAEWLMTTQRPQSFRAPQAHRFLVLTTGVFSPKPSELINEPLLDKILLLCRKNLNMLSLIAHLYGR